MLEVALYCKVEASEIASVRVRQAVTTPESNA